MKFSLASALVLSMVIVGAAQQTVPRGRGGVPVAPNGIPAVPLPDKPLEFDTAEGQKIRVVVVARGMSSPWSMVWLPGGDMLITAATGQVRRLRGGVLDPTPVAGVPASRGRRPRRADGHRAASAVCDQPVRLSELSETRRPGATGHRAAGGAGGRPVAAGAPSGRACSRSRAGAGTARRSST